MTRSAHSDVFVPFDFGPQLCSDATSVMTKSTALIPTLFYWTVMDQYSL